MGADEEHGMNRAPSKDQGHDEDCYVLFPGHTDGWLLFDALKAAGVGARIAPTPRVARATCGMSLLVSCDDRKYIEEAAGMCGASIEGIVRIPRQIQPRRDRYC